MSEQQTSNAGTEGGAGAENATDKTFTQAEVDQIVKARAERMVKQRLGDVDIDELRKKAERFDELEAANKTELEKATEAITAANTRAERAEAALKNERLTSAVTAAAQKAGFIDPTDAAALVDQSAIEFDGDAPKNLDKLLGTLAKSKPHLVKEGAPEPTNGSGDGGPQGSSATTKTPGDIFGDHVAAKLGLPN